MRKVYICSPYAGNTKRHTEIAIEYCKAAIESGYMPVASHLLYPQMLDETSPAERELGVKFGLEMVMMCDEMWVAITASGITKGMAEEIALATSNGVPYKFMKLKEGV